MKNLLFDMGLPMILPAMYLMILGLVPIVLIEAYVISKKLSLAYITGLKSAALGNIISTVVGIPVTWFLLFGIQLATGGDSGFRTNTFWLKLLAVTWQAPWLMPVKRNDEWMVFASMLFLLIPFFFASWYVEYQVMKGRLANQLYYLRVEPEERTESDSTVGKITRNGYLSEIRTVVRNANLWSYGMLALFIVTLFFFS